MMQPMDSSNPEQTSSALSSEQTTSKSATSENVVEDTSSTSEEVTEDVMKAALKFATQLKEAYTREFVFLLVGRTGVGKSSTINQLIGREIAPVGDYEPTTMSVEKYKLPVENVNFVVFDTPGLCDDLPDKGNDKNYIEKMKKEIKYIDCMLYVTPLSDSRIRSDEKYGIELITKAFGEKIWSNSVIVFTFADYVKQNKYQDALSTRTRLMRETIQKNVPLAITDKIPSVAIDNTSPNTPDGKPWIGELYTTVIERVSSDGFVQYLMATAPTLLEAQEAKVVERVVERIVEKPVYIDKPVYINRQINEDQRERVQRRAETEVPPIVAKTAWQKFGETFKNVVVEPVKRGFEKVKGFFGIR